MGGADITWWNSRYTATSGPTKRFCSLSCRETMPPAPQMLAKAGRTRIERGPKWLRMERSVKWPATIEMSRAKKWSSRQADLPLTSSKEAAGPC